jgi:RNA polymerase sigma-70 factor, ECF subfamily
MAHVAVWDWEHARRVCLAAARRVLGASDAAEDAAQEAVLRAWRQQATCRDPADPGPWLRRIATNEALRIVARGKELPEAQDGALEPGPETSQALFVRDLVTRLEPADRRLLYLQYWADVPVRDIAQRLQIPEGTVKIRVHRARASLKRMIEDER